MASSEGHDPVIKSPPENSETLSQHEYFLEPFLSSEINKFPMEVYSTAIQRTLTHIVASFQYCASNSCKHCVLTSHSGKPKYYYNKECKLIGSLYYQW